LSGSDDGTVIVWGLASGAERHRLGNHEDWVLGFAIGADGGTGLSASSNGTVIVWDLTSGHVICRLALSGIANAVALSPTSTVLIGDRKGDITCLEIIFP
jgi:WD40 repeat protein